jgi:predicted dehydrogenase
MKFLIAGLGSIGRRHLQNLLALGEQEIILYRTHLNPAPSLTSGSQSPSPDLSSFPVETNFQAALAHRPDAVVISNPTALHLDVAIPAAAAGCNLLLEKPVSHSLEGIPELVAAVKQGGGQVLMGYQFRYHPGLQKIIELLAASAIGRPLSVRCHWGEYLPGWHPWEDYRQGYSARADLGGGVVLTLSHPLDYLRWIFGEVESLWAFTGKLSDLELSVEDVAEVGLRFQGGVIGSLHLDYFQRPPAHRLEITGTRGTITWNNADGAVTVNTIAPTRESRITNHQFAPPAGFERNDLFLAQMRHFLALIKGETAPHCTLEDGIRALELSLAVERSQKEGQLIQITRP